MLKEHHLSRPCDEAPSNDQARARLWPLAWIVGAIWAVTCAVAHPALAAEMLVISGRYVGDGVNNHSITGAGFKPEVVFVKADANQPMVLRTSGMGGGDVSKELGAATALKSGCIRSLDGDGFTVGTSASVNQAGTTYYWTALKGATLRMVNGSYNGNATDNRLISVGFQPDYVIVMGGTAQQAVQRFSAEVGDSSLTFDGGGEAPDRIQSFQLLGFQIGLSPTVNASSTTYYYVAWTRAAGKIAAGSYAGDGTDNRDILGAGLCPYSMFLSRREAGVPSVARFAAMRTDLTLPVTPGPAFSDGIQSFAAAGFQVGADARVNAPADSFYWVAFQNAAAYDLDIACAADRQRAKEGDSLTFAITLRNFGPASASGLQVTSLLPTTLGFLSSQASLGSYDPTSGRWTVGPLGQAATATLSVVTQVKTGAAGSTVAQRAAITASDLVDLYAKNNVDTAYVRIPLADLVTRLRVDDVTPVETEALNAVVTVRNSGPDAALGVIEAVTLPAGLAYVSSLPSRGSFDSSTGQWSIGTIAAGDSAVLGVALTASSGSAGTQPMIAARVIGSDVTDRVPTNDGDSTTVTVFPPVMRMTSGSYVGNGGASRAVVGVGFQPDLILIKGSGSTATVTRMKPMSGDLTKELGTATAVQSGRIRSLDRDGFSVGADPAVNQSGVTYYWTAFLELPGQMKIGSYVGNATDNRSITGLGFQPGYLMVLGSGATAAMQRFANQGGDASLSYNGGPEVPDRIQRLEADGFQLGLSSDVNASGTTYYYAAWAPSSGLSGQGSYLGDGSDNRSLSTSGFRPQQLWVMRKEGGSPAVWRNQAMSGDLTEPAPPAAGLTNAIQKLEPLGFQAGSDASVNAPAGTYYYAAFRDGRGADLGLHTTASNPIPNEGDTLTLSLQVTNYGPGDATNVQVLDRLPAGLTRLTSTVTQGSFVPTTGSWSVGSLAHGLTATLTLTASVDPGTAGRTLTHSGVLSASTPADQFSDNNADSNAVTVQLADLDVALTSDDATPIENQSVTFTLKLTNRGPHPATGIVARATLPAALTYLGSQASTGLYVPATGRWSIDSLAAGAFATLSLTAAPHSGTADSTFTAAATLVAADQADTVAANNSSATSVTVYPPVMRMMSGSYVGDGAASRAVVGVGFQPDLILIKGSGSTATVTRMKPMSGDLTKELGTATAVQSGRIRSLDRDGFSVGADPAVNQSGVTYYWTAFLELPGQMKIGSYVGNATDNRSITGVGFQPGYLMVLGSGATAAMQRFANQGGDASLSYNGGPEVPDRIQRLEADGFQLGLSSDVNASGTTYYYAAWAPSSGLSGQGSYLGDGSDNRSLSTSGFRPQQLWVMRKEGGSPAVWRNQAMSGDLTEPAPPAAGLTNAIQKLEPLGFQAGSDASVNAPAGTYYYAAFRDGRGADLGLHATASNPIPNEGDTLTLSLQVTNYGPGDATGIQVLDRLPAGLTLLSHTATQGSFVPATGSWSLGSVAPGAYAILTLSARVDPGTAGRTLAHAGSLSVSKPADQFSDNNADSNAVTVQLADLDVALTSDDATPIENQSVTFTLKLTNRGPHPATGIVARATLPAALTYLGSQASTGLYVPATGRWSIDSLAAGAFATLSLTAAPHSGTADSTFTAAATLVAADQADTVAANNSSATSVTVYPPVMRMMSGSYVGDGGASRAVVGVGFQPDLILIKGSGSTATVTRMKPMSGDLTKELGTATAVQSGRIRSLDRDGFSVGADPAVNQSGVTYYWTAFLELPGQMKIGSYVGNATDNRSITGVGFQPGYLMVLGSGATAAMQRFANQGGDASLSYNGGPEVPDRIQRLEADGFQLGLSSDVNASGTTYYYAAWAPSSGLSGQGSYLGDGSDNRSLSTSGFRPQQLWVMRKEGGSPAVWRNQAMSGDLTEPAPPAAGLTNAIQKLEPLGFQAGSDASVNAPAGTYYYAAFRDGRGADLGLHATASNPIPNEGDTLTLSLQVTNYGPGDATNVQVLDRLPAGLTRLTSTVTQGSFVPATGSWSVGSLAHGLTATLTLTASVDPGTAGRTLTHSGVLSASTPADQFSDNNADSSAVTVQLADLDVALTTDDATPIENESVTFTLKLTNRGPHPATGIVARATLPAALTYLGGVTSQGVYNPTSGRWSVGSLAAGGFATLSLTAAPPSGTADSTFTATATLVSADQADTVAANNSSMTRILILHAGARFIIGSYVGDGRPTRPITGTGFQPDLLIIKGTNNAAAVARTKFMPTDAAKELGTSSALLTGRVVSLDPDGFTLGGDPSVNQSGVTYHWAAFLETPGQMEVGSYLGDGTDNRNISGLPFQPGYLMVLGSGATAATQRFAAEAGDASLPFQSGAELTDRIQRLNPDGFQLGASADVNAAGTPYYYALWNGSFDRVQTGLYLGNNVDDRSITGVGFRPSYLIVKRQDTSPSLYRSTLMSSDVALPLGPGFALANAIQSFVADGFQVGTNAGVNATGRVYFYVAFRDLPTLDLALSQAVSDSTPDEGETVTFTIKLVNRGPDEATGVTVSDVLPTGLVYQTHIPSRGVYDPQTHVWNLGSVVSGDSATLAVTALVGPGTAGSVLSHTATISALDQSDSNNNNDVSTASVRVPVADLGVSVTVDHRLPRENDLITYTVTLTNHGPDAASNMVVTDRLPAGLTFSSATASRGSYDAGPGSWAVPSLARGDSARLLLGATVDVGTGGKTIQDFASLIAAEQADTSRGNQTDSVSVVVALGPGLQVTATPDTSTARPGQSGVRLMTVTLLNSSAEPCTLQRIVMTNQTSGPGSASQLDAELGTVVMHLDDGDGTFELATDPRLRSAIAVNDTVTFDSLKVGIESGSVVKLHVAVDTPVRARDGDVLGLGIVAPADVKFDRVVTFLNSWPVAPTGRLIVDGMSAVQIVNHSLPATMASAGSHRQLAFDVTLPANGYEPDILRSIRFSNLGDALPGQDIEKVEVWGDGSNGTFDGGGPDDFPIGTASWDGATWAISGLSLPVPLEGRRVFVSVDLRDSARTGHKVRFGLGLPGDDAVRMESGNDGPIDTLVAGDSLSIDPGPSTLRLRVVPQSTQTLLPGQSGVSVLRFEIANVAAAAETLRAVTLTNNSTGPGTAAQLDHEWLPLSLLIQGSPAASGTFAARRVVFSNLDIPIAAGDTLRADVQSGASLVARDGDLLDASIGSTTDLTFSRTVRLLADGSLAPEGSFPVDGMSAAQLVVGSQVAAEVLTGTSRNLALEIRVPGNGYTSDVLQFLLVRNTGDAAPQTDVSRLEAWADNGDGLFEPGGSTPDRLLGEMSFTGGDWALGGFSAVVPDSGLRIFFSCDIPRDAFEGRTVRLVIPSAPIPGIGMASGNDGPRDLAVESPAAMTLRTVDHVTLLTQAIAPASAAPGDTAVALLHLVVRNTYRDSVKTLTGLTVTNLTSSTSGATRTELDAEIQSLVLRDSSGTLASSFFAHGKATFTGLAWRLMPGETRDLYMVGHLSTNAAADGDILGASVQDESNLAFADLTDIAARFPLNSGASVRIDGMTSRQLQVNASRDTTLGPDEGPALAFDWIVPRNGYIDDVLEGVELANVGSATPADLLDIHLWRDGGDGAFGGGAGDDRDLGSLSFTAGRWVSRILSEPIGAGGARLFATVATTSNPTDSATVRLSIAQDGIHVGSGNDGPRDAAVPGTSSILLSRSRLLATIEIDPHESVVGDTVAARVTVRNTGDVEITGITPTGLQFSGNGAVLPISGPVPGSLDLLAGAAAAFNWSFVSNGPGTLQASVAVAGTEQGTGFIHHSLPVTTTHRVYARPSGLDVYVLESMPFSIARGQTQVVPLNITLTHPGDPSVSDILFERLTLRFEDESGNAVAPGSLLSRIALSEGTTIYRELVNLPSSGATLDLLLSPPLRLTTATQASSQATLSLSLDVSDSTRVPSFRLVMPDTTSMAAVGAVNTAPVPIRLQAPQVFPIRTGLARIVAGATELDVAGVQEPAKRVDRGQTGVGFLSLTLQNPGPVALGPDVRLSAFAVSLVDSATQAPVDAAQVLKRIRVSSGGRTLLDRAVVPADSAALVIGLSPPLSIPINTPTSVQITGDVADSASLGGFRLRLADSTSFSARNSTTGATVPALLATHPIQGPSFAVQLPAESLRVLALPAVVTHVAIGATDVNTMSLLLRHPGPAGMAAIRLDALSLRCRDQLSRLLPPASVIKRATVLVGGQPRGTLLAVPSSAVPLTIPVTGTVLAPGESATLVIQCDIEASAPAGLFELALAGEGIVALDDNSGVPVIAAADSGAEFPLSSGFIELEAPARELSVGFHQSMPAMLAAGGQPTSVATLSFRNRSPAGEIRIDHLDLVAADAALNSVALGDFCARLEVWISDSLWAATDLAPGAAIATLAATPISIKAQSPVEADVRVVARQVELGRSFRLGCRREGIGVLQPSSPLLFVSVSSDEGQTFPFWTDLSSASPTTLRDSYANFPNPFAAGRTSTSFSYFLRQDAKVTLDIWTARGERVASLVSSSPRAAGLHLEDRWDGRNGAGQTVTNGVYLAELVAQYADGTRERIMRKVAVAR